MGFGFNGERIAHREAKQIGFDDLVHRLRTEYSRQEIYGGLLWYARLRHWKDGWAAFAFRELWGRWPLDSEKTAPICIIGTILEEWIAKRPKRR